MKLQHCILFLSLWLTPVFSKSKDFACYCIKYDNDLMFVDSCMTLGEVESGLFLFNVHYLSNDLSSTLGKINISKGNSSDILEKVLSRKALRFTMKDLDILSEIKPSMVTGYVGLSDGKRVSKHIFDDPEAWVKDKDGKIKINVFFQGYGADSFSLNEVKKELEKLAIEESEGDMSSNVGHASTNSLMFWIGGPLFVTVIAGSAHTFSNRKHDDEKLAKKVVENEGNDQS